MKIRQLRSVIDKAATLHGNSGDRDMENALAELSRRLRMRDRDEVASVVSEVKGRRETRENH